MGISGTDYLPAVPESGQVEARLAEILATPDPSERALELFCFCVRSQLFWDGNKRLATMLASKILIENGIGVLTIGAKTALAFNEGLLHYYNTADSTRLKAALQACVKTMEKQPFPLENRLAAAKAQADAQQAAQSIPEQAPKPKDKNLGLER